MRKPPQVTYYKPNQHQRNRKQSPRRSESCREPSHQPEYQKDFRHASPLWRLLFEMAEQDISNREDDRRDRNRHPHEELMYPLSLVRGQRCTPEPPAEDPQRTSNTDCSLRFFDFRRRKRRGHYNHADAQ